MKASILLIAASAGATLAHPAYGYDFCPDAQYPNPHCCLSDVLGVLALDCSTPSRSPADVSDFETLCRKEGGKAAKCCPIPTAGQSLICNDAGLV